MFKLQGEKGNQQRALKTTDDAKISNDFKESFYQTKCICCCRYQAFPSMGNTAKEKCQWANRTVLLQSSKEARQKLLKNSGNVEPPQDCQYTAITETVLSYNHSSLFHQEHK